MHQSTLAELSSALESKKISSEELIRGYIERCKKHNVSLNCFITITEDEAIKKATSVSRLVPILAAFF